MHEIVIISGKGGTGKSSVCAALAHMAEGQAVICDLDVDVPDLHILLQPQDGPVHPFMAGHRAVIDPLRCTNCGVCTKLCRFAAIQHTTVPKIDTIACEGCGVCARLCPEKAIELSEQPCGQWTIGSTRFGDFVHAELFPGEENSGKLITLLKREARSIAKATNKELILHDGSPGIGCAVISSLVGAKLAVAVVEPTPSGRHDFERIGTLCRHFRIPVCVIINKVDMNPSAAEDLRTFLAAEGYILAGELPFSREVSQAMVHRMAFTELSASLYTRMTSIWERILQTAGLSVPST